MELIKNIARIILSKEIEEYKTQIKNLHKSLDDISIIAVDSLEEEKTQLEEYCEKNYKQIPMIAYEQKRDIKGKKYPIALNELITYDSYAILKLFKLFNFMNDTNKQIAKKVGNKVAQTLTWDSDNNLDKSGDYYLYPNESLARIKCDCEDHAFVCASAHAEIGCAWGTYEGETTYGHAFNVFIHEDKLYILDACGDRAKIEEYNSDSNYKIDYIITKDNSYSVLSRFNFGTVAGW